MIAQVRMIIVTRMRVGRAKNTLSLMGRIRLCLEWQSGSLRWCFSSSFVCLSQNVADERTGDTILGYLLIENCLIGYILLDPGEQRGKLGLF